MKPHVLLIRPLCEGYEPEFAEPLGIERLAGYLQAAGAADVTVMDRRLYQQKRRTGMDRGSFWADLRKECREVPPCVVGLSLMTSADVPDALRIISRVRAWWPDARLVVGGLYVTTSQREASQRLPRAVTLLCGEGEAALLAVVKGTPMPKGALGPGEWAMAYRPALERYAALGCAVNMQTSRGCPGRCTFCATPSLAPELRRWQPRDLSLVVDEIEAEAKRLGRAGLPPVFNFVDDDFGPLLRVEALADELARRQLRVAFALEMRVASFLGQPQLTERLARLHEAGLTRVFMGVESLNAQTLRRWRKPYDVEALPAVLSACREAGVTVQPGYILWHGGQTVEGAAAEVEELVRLGIYSHRAAQSRLIVFEGCALAREGSDSMGLQPMDARSESFYQRFCDQTDDLTQEWVAAAVIEPYATAAAFLTGSTTRLDEIQQRLQRVNEASLVVFRELAHKESDVRGQTCEPSASSTEVSS